MSERARKTAERIRELVPLIEVLADYGFLVDPNVPDRGQQFSCTLHGDGSDSKPSAHYYPDTGQFFCFACGRSRDAIALVRELENIGFWSAVRQLEKRFGLTPLPWEAGAEDRPQTPRQVVEAALNPHETAEQALHRLNTFLMNLTRERSLAPEVCAGLWEAHDRVLVYADDEGDEKAVLGLAHKVLQKAKDALKALAEE